jgi:pseudouridine-5'-phosphate glycosidase
VTAVQVGAEVGEALASGRPVVALESTIITHGMPYPANLETGEAVEAVVRERGAVPATIAVVDGVPRAGLDADMLRRLALGEGVAKASRRDLPALIAAGADAGTTVAATMYLAHRAGIGVFATGGIGGVHRGAERSFDVSADLVELGRTPVVVVCAGAKSILDLPKTLEVLETLAVPLIGYRTGEFPAFFTRSSGLPLDHRVDDVAALAAVVVAQRDLGVRSGVLVANPVPESDALNAAEVGDIIEAALIAAERDGVTGQAVTPYLLAAVNDLTRGASLRANVALVRNNAALAADLARHLTP